MNKKTTGKFHVQLYDAWIRAGSPRAGRIANELDCSVNTVKRYIKLGGAKIVTLQTVVTDIAELLGADWKSCVTVVQESEVR